MNTYKKNSNTLIYMK